MKKLTSEVILALRVTDTKILSYFAIILLNAVMFPAIQILLGFTQKILVNSIEYNIPRNIILVFILSGVILFLFAVANPFFEYLKERIVRSMMTRIRIKALDHINRLPVSYFDKVNSGTVLSIMNSDMNSIQMIYGWSLFRLALALFYGLGSIIAMFFLCWPLAIFILFLGMFETLIMAKMSEKIRELSETIQERMGMSNEQFVNMLQGFRIIKILSISSLLQKKYRKENDAILKESETRNSKILVIDSVNDLFKSFNLLGILAIGVILLNLGIVDLGTVMAFLVLQDGVSYMFDNISTAFPELQQQLASAARLIGILNTNIEDDGNVASFVRHPSSGILSEVPLGLSCKDLDFRYDCKNEQTLSRICFEAEPGKFTAIVGTSGSGKSTFLKILVGLYRPTGGQIHIGNKMYQNLSLAEIRSFITYIPQEPFMASESIADNIRFGKPTATDDEVMAAAKEACAHDFIVAMPEAYNTILNEDATNVSGGQRQRIAIARALIRDTPILIFDEATTGLDSESDMAIQGAIDRLIARKRTVIVVAHRLSTIGKADVVFVMDRGSLVAHGSVQEISREGILPELKTTVIGT